jgi:RNase H-fold protein (predicted Holliday junction resolvase)
MAQDSVWLGFDPGRDKCGIAVRDSQRVLLHQVVAAADAIATLETLQQQYGITQIIMGDQTSARQWQQRLQQELTHPLPICFVDERYSSLEARDRYWEMYPPRGWQRLVPKGMRTPARPIDDIVAILLIERYLAAKSAPES